MTQLHSKSHSSALKPKRIWASLITNMDYLPGLLTLHHTLYNPSPEIRAEPDAANPDTAPSTGSAYPFVALYTASFPVEGLKALRARRIQSQLVQSVTPAGARSYAADPRFAETWTKLVAFSLVEYERVVLLDGDIVVRRNMDELMEDVELDSRETLDAAAADSGEEREWKGKGENGRVFAAAHACACNPMKKPHYPAHWIPENCAYTTQHNSPEHAQTHGPDPSAGVGMLNGGVLVLTPSLRIYSEITSALSDTARIERYDFPDQELLSEVFSGRWVPLPYIYNALKTLRWSGVHGAIWRDERVRAVHYIFATKPWHEAVTERDAQDDSQAWQQLDETNRWWWDAEFRRRRVEREGGIDDKFSRS